MVLRIFKMNAMHQWLSDSFRVPGPRFPRPSSWFKGPYFRREGRGGREERERRRGGREREGPPPLRTFLEPPLEWTGNALRLRED